MTVALIPVAVGAGAIPMLGMLMLPKNGMLYSDDSGISLCHT